MVVFPNAKINLGLNIVNRRNDGYHNIESVFIPVMWRDVLEIVPAKGMETTLTVTGRGVNCPAEKNLVMKAYRALNEVTPLPAVDIYLRKIIPDGAGLGGGSADAAFTLSALNDLFALGLNKSQLAGIASSLGADCPFFIHNRPMLATGTGTELSEFDIPHLSGLTILIVKPDVHISTAVAYSGVTPKTPSTPLCRLLDMPVENWSGLVHNDFEISLKDNFPILTKIKDELYSRGAVYASLSGSGSALYGLFKSDKMAEFALKSFECHECFKYTIS